MTTLENQTHAKWSFQFEEYILLIIDTLHDSQLWIIGSEGTVFLFDSSNAKILQRFDTSADLIFSATLSSVNSHLYIGTSRGVFCLSPTGETIPIIVENKWYEHIALNNKNNTLICTQGKNLIVLQLENATTTEILRDQSFSSTISDVQLVQDGFLVASFGSVRKYHFGDLHKYEVYPWKTSLIKVNQSPNTKWIVSSTQENNLHFWYSPLNSGDDFQISGYEEKVKKFLWSDDSNTFAISCGEDVQLWDFSKGPPQGQEPQMLICGYGKIVDICLAEQLLIAASDLGFLFYFIPELAKTPFAIHSVGDEITHFTLNKQRSELLVGTKAGLLSCIDLIKLNC